MSGWRLRRELFGRRATWAVTAAVVAVASLGTVAFASTSASDREGRFGSVDLGEALVAGRDGKLTVAGLSRRGSSRLWALARYTAAGTLDRSFGTGGKVLTDFGARSEGGARSLAIGRDGKIVVTGYMYLPPRTYSGFAIARYTSSGKLDPTFGRNGRVVTYFGSRGASAQAVAIQANGRIVAVGRGDAGSRSGFALARYTRQGRLDRRFGRGGKVLTNFGVRGSAGANAVAIQPDGRIAVAGDLFRGSRTDFALARYNVDGTLDQRFGNRGRIVARVGDADSYPSTLVVQKDGKLVVGGSAYLAPAAAVALVRFSAEGALDPGFGRGGTVVTNAGSGSALAIQRDRKLVMAGTGSGRIRGEFALARFLEDGSLDESFGRDGKLLTAFHRRAVANAVVVRADGKIVVGGTVAGLDFALARYTSSGTLDGSFGRGGKVLTDFRSVWATRGR